MMYVMILDCIIEVDIFFYNLIWSKLTKIDSFKKIYTHCIM